MQPGDVVFPGNDCAPAQEIDNWFCRDDASDNCQQEDEQQQQLEEQLNEQS